MSRVQFMRNLASMIKAKVYVELGVRDGQTINAMINVIPTCIGVDIVSTNSKKYDKRIQFNKMSTDQYAKVCKEEIDMLFIDADHSHESSYRDFLNFKDKVRTHGIILLHDTCPFSKEMISPRRCGDSYKTAIKIKEEHQHECEIMTIPDGMGLSIVRMNRGEHLIWGNK